MRRIFLALALTTAACGGSSSSSTPDANVTPQPDANVSQPDANVVTQPDANVVAQPDAEVVQQPDAAPVDTTPPTVASTTPTNGAVNYGGATIAATFSEPVQSGTITLTVVSTASGAVAGTASYDSGSDTVTFTPTSALAANDTITVTVSAGVQDLAGNKMAADYVFSFGTTDDIAPVLTGVTPLAGAVNVTGPVITASFSETIAGATLTVVDAGGANVDGTIDVTGGDVLFTPGTALPDGLYTATVSGATDLAGNPQEGSFTWTFAVGIPTAVATTQPTFVFGQDASTTDSELYFFPGQANAWDLTPDLVLSDGGDDQFDTGFQLTVGATLFPINLTAADMTFLSPQLGAADGVQVAAVSDGSFIFNGTQGTRNNWGMTALDGQSAFLAPIEDARLQQKVDLSASSGDVVLSWLDHPLVCDGSKDNVINIAAYYRVQIYDADTGELILDAADVDATTNTDTGTATLLASDVTAHPHVLVSFEQYGEGGTGDNTAGCSSSVDDVTLVDQAGAGTDYLTNGNFETGDLSGWTTNAPANLQNVTTSAQTVEGLTVTRSFFTAPNRLWGRWVDTFENDGTDPVTTTIHYHNDVGSDSCGVIFEPAGDTSSLSEWDLFGDDTDLGFYFGQPTTLTYTSATMGVDLPNNVCDGNDTIDETFDLTVQPGAKATIVQFIILDGVATYQTAAGDVSVHPTAIEAALADIGAHFWTDAQYRWGMTDDQIASIANIPLP